jgi:hypothetical protein
MRSMASERASSAALFCAASRLLDAEALAGGFTTKSMARRSRNQSSVGPPWPTWNGEESSRIEKILSVCSTKKSHERAAWRGRRAGCGGKPHTAFVVADASFFASSCVFLLQTVRICASREDSSTFGGRARARAATLVAAPPRQGLRGEIPMSNVDTGPAPWARGGWWGERLSCRSGRARAWPGVTADSLRLGEALVIFVRFVVRFRREAQARETES